jgi:Endomembrane protein 70
MDRRVDITNVNAPKDVSFSYSVEWFEEPELKWKDRMTRYVDSKFIPSSFEIHWLSIINSFVLVLLLTAFLTIILLRILKNDFSRYMELDDDALEEEESGWKLIHGDVFRFPEQPMLFCAAVGTGNQLIVLTIFHLTLALTNIISTNRRGSILAGVVVLYCLTSFVGGYTAVRLYRQMNGKNWVHCILLTAGLFPAPVVFVFLWVNSVALAHGSTSALPFTAILTVVALYAFISFPLTLFGGMLAKNYANAEFDAPTRTTKVAREIPTEVPFYRGRPFQILIAGFLPFSAIYIELHYIFASMWGHQLYTLFGILFLAFVLLVIVTSFITVALLYFQLAREDHRWWWATYINGGMTGLFIYLYSFYYYFHRSGMKGILQGSFYFGYMAICSLAFFLMLGSAGFQFSLIFVKYIYSRIKSD